MAKYTLHIDCEDVHELASISNRLAGLSGTSPVANAVYSGEIAMPEAAPVAEVAKRGRKSKDTPLSGSPAPAADVSQTETPAESATTAAIATTSGEQTSAPATTSPTPAPAAAATGTTAPAAQAPSDGAAVTYEDLKAALTKLMEKKSAKVAQETLKKSVGFGSLSSTPPDKYGAALAAINAELAT